MEEGLRFEQKGYFDWNHGQPHAIAKTIVAFANTQGGKILLKGVECDKALLDSARITDFVNKSVAPPVSGISTESHENGDCTITVEPSESAPHIFIKNASYKDSEGNDKSAWHAGQVYARHSSKTEPANADDLARNIQVRVSQWLSKLGSAMESLSLDIKEGKSALPVSISDGPSALKIGIADPNRDYPYLTKTLGKKIKKTQDWTQCALKRLGCKDNPIYSMEIRGVKGEIVMRRYNERALTILTKKIAECPDYDPYHD
jgi:hypothetical protein